MRLDCISPGKESPFEDGAVISRVGLVYIVYLEHRDFVSIKVG